MKTWACQFLLEEKGTENKTCMGVCMFIKEATSYKFM